MKLFTWTITDRETGEKLSAGKDWAETYKDLVDFTLKPVLRDFSKSPEQVSISATSVSPRLRRSSF